MRDQIVKSSSSYHPLHNLPKRKICNRNTCNERCRKRVRPLGIIGYACRLKLFYTKSVNEFAEKLGLNPGNNTGQFSFVELWNYKILFTGHCINHDRSAWKCLTSNECIPRSRLCDGQAQCRDLSDESICSSFLDCFNGSIYSRNFYKMSPGRNCIPTILICDGVPDCINHSDERNCNLYLK